MPKKGGKRKKTKTHLSNVPIGATKLEDKDEKESVPQSIVVKVSKVAAAVAELTQDIRHLMSPNTASNLRERSYNRMHDYVGVAGQLGVSHLLGFSQTENNVILRIAKIPSGPTIHFRVQQYTLSRMVRASQKKPYESSKIFLHAPLVVLNGFGQSEQSHVKLMRAAFQNMFPTINVDNVKLAECRRVVLFHVNKDDETVELRHYAIKATPVGVSRSVKKILQSKIPDLSKLEDVSEFVQGQSGAASDSEAEDESNRIVLPETYSGRGNIKSQKCSMRLIELGPRLKLEAFKVERGVCEGDVLYHKFEQKSPEEAEAIKKKVEAAKLLKIKRRAEQEENVRRKKALAAEKPRRGSRHLLTNGDEDEDEEQSGSDEYAASGDSDRSDIDASDNEGASGNDDEEVPTMPKVSGKRRFGENKKIAFKKARKS